MPGLFTTKSIREAPCLPAPYNGVNLPQSALNSSENYGDLGFQIRWALITAPVVLDAEPHKHDYPQYLCFLSNVEDNNGDPGWVIEISLGLDKGHMEQHTLNRPSTVYLPPGLYHGRLVFEKLKRPVTLLDINCAGLYKKLGRK